MYLHCLQKHPVRLPEEIKNKEESMARSWTAEG